MAPKEDSPDLELLSPFYLQTWGQDAQMRRQIASREHLAKGFAVLDVQSRLLKALYDRGVSLVPGSAAPNPWLLPGRSLLDELALWKRAGIPVEDCIRAATAGACERLGIELRGRSRRPLRRPHRGGGRSAGGHRRLVPARGRRRARTRDGAQGARRARVGAARAQKKAREEMAKPLEVGTPDLPDGDVILRGRVETRAIGLRVSAERFAVVRRFDGALVYCGRMRTLGQGSLPDTETLVEQVVADGNLVVVESRCAPARGPSRCAASRPAGA